MNDVTNFRKNVTSIFLMLTIFVGSHHDYADQRKT